MTNWTQLEWAIFALLAPPILIGVVLPLGYYGFKGMRRLLRRLREAGR